MNFVTYFNYFLLPVLLVQGHSSTQSINIMDIINQIRSDNVMKYSISSKNEICNNHANIFLESLKNGTLWAMQMFDAATKFPESVLMGQTIHLGNFDECIGVENVQTMYGSFSGKHCLTTVSLPLEMPSESTKMLMNNKQRGVNALAQFPEFSLKTMADTVPDVDQNLDLVLSYCIPSTCSAADFQNMLNVFISTDLPNITIQAALNEASCQTKQGRSLATEDWVTVGILIFIATLVISSTAYDLLKKEPRRKILTAFSWYSNGRRLVNITSSEDNIHAVYGIRFLTMCWVILSNRYLMSVSVPTINATTVPDMLKNFWRIYISNATLSGDTFLFLSGFLIAYVFLVHMNKENASLRFAVYGLHRNLRISPSYAMMILINATLIRYMSSGPLYHSATDVIAENCQTYWWQSILFLNNLLNTDKSCLSQGWYIAVDMQLFNMSLLFVYPLWKWPRKWSFALLGAFITIGLVVVFVITFIFELPPTLYVFILDIMSLQYYSSYMRIVPWLIGIVFGYVIHETKKQDINLSKIKVLMGWCFGLLALLGSLLGAQAFNQIDYLQLNKDANQDDFPSIFESSFYTTLSRPVWALGVGWIVFACVSGYGGPVNTFLSWKVFQPLSRLTYCVFLVHVTYQTIRTYSVRTPTYISDFNIIPDFFSDVVACLFLATVLSLCIERPIMMLEEHMMGEGRFKRKKKSLKDIEKEERLKQRKEDQWQTQV